MVDTEPSATGGSFGGGSRSDYEEQRFYQSAAQQLPLPGGWGGYGGGIDVGKSSRSSSLTSGKLEKVIDSLVGSLTKLQSATDKLATSFGQKANMSGSGDPGVGPTDHQGSTKSANPHAGFGKAAVAAGVAATYAAGNLFGSRAAQTEALAPSIAGLQLYSGLGYKGTARALANRALTFGTTGAGDTLAAAGAAQQLTGFGAGNPIFNSTMHNYSEIALTNPGMSLTQASQVYGALRSPQVNWMLQGRFGPNAMFAGQGGTSPDYIGRATALVRNLVAGNPAVNPNNPTDIGAAFAQGGRPLASLNNITGDAGASQALVNSVIAQTRYSQAGGSGTLFGDINYNKPSDWRKFQREANKAGYTNDVTNQEWNLNSLDAKNSLVFSADQGTNVARSLAVQLTIRDTLNKIAIHMGVTGVAGQVGAQAINAVTGPLGGALSALGIERLLTGSKLFGGAGAGAAGAGGAGGLQTTTAAAGPLAEAGPAALAVLGGLISRNILVGLLGGKNQSKTSGRNRLVGAGVDALAGAGIGTAILPGPGTLVGAGLGALVGGFTGIGDGSPSALDRRHIGDGPATMSDMQLVQSRSNTGNATSVTGLRPQMLADTAALMRHNPNLRLNSGYRSIEEQKRLYDNYKKHGGAEVAPPGNSMHQQGLAVDFGPTSEYNWLHQNAGKAGLVNYTPEPWHWEPAGASNAGNRTNYGIGPVPGYVTGGASGSTSTAAAAGPATPSNNLMSVSSSFGGAFGASQGEVHSALSGAATEQGSSVNRAGFLSPNAGVAAGTAGTDGGGGGGGGGGLGAGSNTVGGMPSVWRPQGGSVSIDPYQLGSMMKKAGFSTSVNPAWGHSPLVEFLAAAKGESGLHIDAVGDVGIQTNVWGPSIGLFQDRTLKAQTGTGGPRDAKALWGNSNFQVNAAYQISGGGNDLGPWGGPNYPAHHVNIPWAESIANSGRIGDAPMGVASGGSSAMAPLRPQSVSGGGGTAVLNHRPITASFVVQVMSATQDEAEKFAQYAWKRIKQLDEQERSRSI